MTLLVTIFAAVISTVAWYKQAPRDDMKISTLCFMYWGASLMWLVDGIVEYIEMGAEFFAPPVEELVSGLYLGLCFVALGLIAWLVILLVKDPKGVVRAALAKRS